MSIIGSEFKRKIAKAILSSIRWDDAREWLSTGTRVQDIEVSELGNGELMVRVKTWQDGTYYFSIKVTEKL